MDKKRLTLSHQSNFCVNHKTVSGLLQEAHIYNIPFVRVQPLEREIRGFSVWGVLVTARLFDEVHIAWVVTGHLRLPALVRTEFAEAQQQVAQHIHALAAQMGLDVRQGFYSVTPEALLYQYAAALPVVDRQEGDRL